MTPKTSKQINTQKRIRNKSAFKLDIADKTELCKLYFRTSELFECSETWNKDQSLVIDRETFAKGYETCAFKLQPCDFCGNFMKRIRQGNVCHRIIFAKVPTSAVNDLVFEETSVLLENDNSRKRNGYSVMNSLQLKYAINYVPRLKQQVEGVFYRDNLLEKVSKFPSAYICNTDYSTGAGILWIAIRSNTPVMCDFVFTLLVSFLPNMDQKLEILLTKTQ